MGLCNSTPPQYTILCNNDGIIQYTSPLLLLKLGYNMETLNGKFIGILMNDFMYMLHEKYYIKMFKESSGKERNLIENKLKNFNHKRPLIIYDINTKAHHTHVSIIPSSSNLQITFEFIKEDINDFYILPNIVTNEFKENKNDSIIIMTDFIQSTELLEEKGIVNLIHICSTFNEVITSLIRDKYFPYIYIHETVGDSFILIMNTEWTHNNERFCASLAINFLFELIQKTKHFIKIRTGIGYGRIHYGKIGNIFRFFGRPLHIAARLENKCNENKINICEKLYIKLKSEMDILERHNVLDEITEKTENLKGFGNKKYYSINVSESSPFLLY